MADDLINTAGGLLGLAIVAGVAENIFDNDRKRRKKKRSRSNSDGELKW